MSALLLPNQILSMSAQAAHRLVEAGDGDCALLYLALMEQGDTERAGRALHWGEDRLAAAHRRLAELELVAAETAPVKAHEEDKLPQYTRKDIADAMEREPEFCGLYREVERRLGRTLSDADLNSLYTIYDGLAMPVEVILPLVSYVIHCVRRQSGQPGAVPRMTQIKSEAFRWKRRGLDTTEAAEQYIRSRQQVESREWGILSAVGVTEPRPAVEKEREFISGWVELGFSDELIALAYERTVYNKGKMNWPYLNKILLRWHESGLRTPEQVKAEDRPAVRKNPATGRQEDYQPTAERIRQNDQWLDEFLKQQEKRE